MAMRGPARWLASLLALLALAAGAQTVAPDPLADLAAESRERRFARTPVSQPWRHLTRERLAQWLQGEELARLPRFEGLGTVIDQAGAWDLLHFDKPSDVRAQWHRWSRPEHRRSVDPGAQPASLPSQGFGLYADAAYSDEAGAFVALWNCLAPAAWHVAHQHPMLWALEQGQPWDENGGIGFGGCVRQQSETSGLPERGVQATTRGLRSARVIADRLVAHLQRAGCSGSGPDDCLVVLHALLSLAPSRPELPALAASVLDHHRRVLGELPPLPPVAPAPRLAELRRDLMERVLLLDLALQLERAQPAGLPVRDTFAQLQSLVERQLALDVLQQGLRLLPRLRDTGAFAPPWRALHALADADPRWAAEMGSAVAMLAATPDCERAAALAFVATGWPDRDGWLQFAAQRLADDRPECRSLDLSGLAASQADPDLWQARNARPLAAAPLQRLQAMLGDESRSGAHLRLLQALAGPCPRAHDPWQVCRWTSPEQQRLGQPQAMLPVRAADRFAARRLPPADGSARGWLVALQRVGLAREPALAQTVAAALPAGATEARLWRHPRHPLAALELITPRQDDGARPHQLLLIGRHDARRVELPGDGQPLQALSDIDGDGRLELWFGDLAARRVALGGEVFGRHLLPYLPGPPPTAAR